MITWTRRGRTGLPGPYGGRRTSAARRRGPGRSCGSADLVLGHRLDPSCNRRVGIDGSFVPALHLPGSPRAQGAPPPAGRGTGTRRWVAARRGRGRRGASGQDAPPEVDQLAVLPDIVVGGVCTPPTTDLAGRVPIACFLNNRGLRLGSRFGAGSAWRAAAAAGRAARCVRWPRRATIPAAPCCTQSSPPPGISSA